MMTSHKTVLCEVRQRTSDGNYREKKSCIVEQAQVKNREAITCVYHKEVVRKGREQHESSVTMVREEKMDKGRKQVQEAYRKEVRGPAQQAERSESPKRESTTNTLKDKNITSGNQMADRRTVTLETRARTFSLTACGWVFPIVVIVLFATTMAIIYIMADRRTVTLETRARTFSLTACSWVFPIVVIVLFATTMAIIYIMADALMADRRTVTLETRACTFSLTACSWVFPIVVIVLFATTMAIIYIMADVFMAKNR